MNLTRVFTKTAITTPERQLEADADLVVIRQVQAGDVSAFDKLIVKYRERVYGVVYNMTSNREDAADLTQDSFIKAFQAINRFQGNCSFFTWLYKIAVNTTLSHLRKNKMRSFFSLEKLNEEGGNAQVLDQLTDKRGADRDTYLHELQEKLNEGMQKLSIPHRTVITLYEIDGLSHSDIAEIMGCSEGTVRSRLHYAKQFLQGELGKYIRS
ncbi:ECF RNA polymerase sigma-E factor [Lacunisphaera limnophila]|uniref:ECF RNA polymerase sigma-E factor n=1 Tax=Lacunisphaera limnophila TaxID=1838286 RepID=A0A1D8AUV0_9BACT|nr:sigma-70 family RNA polymerase sigma factor [Lacunisphaera limnophila]AOS44626.1 ECF RNA polymerase sigma-E factor [Lacunisphaera limnophila]